MGNGWYSDHDTPNGIHNIREQITEVRMMFLYFLGVLTRAEPVLGAEHAGPGIFDPASTINRLLGHVAAHRARHSKMLRIMTKLQQPF